MKATFFKDYNFYNFHSLKAAFIHVSDTCNFRCKICDLSSKRKKSFVPTVELKQKLKKAKKLGLSNIIFTGQEVILHPNIDEIIRWSFNAVGVNYIAIITNGLAFADNRIQGKLASLKKYMNRVYLGVSINFYNAATFSDWSGHNKQLFKIWSSAFKKTADQGFVSYIDIILKRDMSVPKILNYLEQLTDGQSKRVNLRVADLMCFSAKHRDIYGRLKFSLIKTKEQIEEIAKIHPGKIEFEAFPVCVFNQRDLKDGKYFIPGFSLSFENGIPTQYDPLVYGAYYHGPTENWIINQKELFDAYHKMFYYVNECYGCYYKNKCCGIQNEHIKCYSEESINKEIKLLKSINWR